METTNSGIPNFVNASNFQQVLITQALKPDRLHKVLTTFSLNQLSRLLELVIIVGILVMYNEF